MQSGDVNEGLQAELAAEPARLHEIEAQWRELAVARGNAFMTPEWFQVSQRHYGDEQAPSVAIVSDADGGLAGLLPLVATGRTARFAGSSLGDHFQPVAPGEREAAVATAAGLALRAEAGRSPALILENVDAEAAWWTDLSRAAGCGEHPLVDRATSLPSVHLAGRTWDEYLGSRSRNFRSQVGRKYRALERDHEVRVRWTRKSDEVATDMATLFRLHDMRWEARAGTSSLTGERARAFHTDFAGALAERGWLRLCFLEIDGAPVAGWYGWRVGERFAYYQAGFDPSWSDRSVGFVLLSQTIRAATEEGAAHYDMLLGEEGFKGRFADDSRPVVSVLVASRRRPLRLIAGAEAGLRRASARLPDSGGEPAKRAARRMLERLPMARRR